MFLQEQIKDIIIKDIIIIIPRLVPRGAASKDFGDRLKATLALAERYPAQSLPLYVLRAFAQFLPALLEYNILHLLLKALNLATTARRNFSTSSFSCNDGPLEQIIISHASKESPML